MEIDLKIGDIVLDFKEFDKKSLLEEKKKLFSNQYYVYEIIDPRNNKVIYVGKGTKRRCFNHYFASKNKIEPNRNNNNKLFYKIKKIIALNLELKYRIIFSSDKEEECYKIESERIKYYGINNLCNLSMCHEGAPKHTIETKNKISKAHLGKILSQDTKDKLRKINLERPPITQDTRNKLSESLKYSYMSGKKLSWNKGLTKESNDTIRKQSEKMKGRLGFRHSEETKNKMREKQKGKIITLEQRNKIRNKLLKSKEIINTNCEICFKEIENILVVKGKTKIKSICSMKCSAQKANRTKIKKGIIECI